MSPNEELREASKLMRERAGKATPGPWAEPYFTDEREAPGDGGWWVHNSVKGIREHAVAVALPYNPRGGADAEHIASWHPAVTTPVADALDAAAKVWEFNAERGYETRGDCAVALLAAARAYLGDPS